MKLKLKIKNRILKRAQKGFRGYPVATVAYYGPDNRRATKAALSIISYDGAEAQTLMRWWTLTTDARLDEEITRKALEMIDQQGANSVVAVSKLLGCPHEEGKDYPLGKACPECPYWAGRDRWKGVIEEHEEMLGEGRI
jgi:hypothetical protein